MRILPHAFQLIEQGMIEAGFNMLRSNDRGAGLTGNLSTAIQQQPFKQLARAEREIACTDIHDDAVIDGG
jgi:hypothetical protein